MIFVSGAVLLLYSSICGGLGCPAPMVSAGINVRNTAKPHRLLRQAISNV
jgi:hypothetical protein